MPTNKNIINNNIVIKTEKKKSRKRGTKRNKIPNFQQGALPTFNTHIPPPNRIISNDSFNNNGIQHNALLLENAKRNEELNTKLGDLKKQIDGFKTENHYHDNRAYHLNQHTHEREHGDSNVRIEELHDPSMQEAINPSGFIQLGNGGVHDDDFTTHFKPTSEINTGIFEPVGQETHDLVNPYKVTEVMNDDDVDDIQFPPQYIQSQSDANLVTPVASNNASEPDPDTLIVDPYFNPISGTYKEGVTLYGPGGRKMKVGSVNYVKCLSEINSNGISLLGRITK